MALIQPFDLLKILGEDVSGDFAIFGIILFLFAGVLMAKFNLSSKLALPLFVLFAMMMSVYIPWLFLLVMIVLGFGVFRIMSKIFG